MDAIKDTQQILIQYIIGDNNNTSYLSSQPVNPLPVQDVIELIEENRKLRSDLQWAMEQIRIKDLLLKKL